MFDKYFGFLKSHDEQSIFQTLLEHAKIDAEELIILSKMMSVLEGKETGNLNIMHQQIQQVNNENIKTSNL